MNFDIRCHREIAYIYYTWAFQEENSFSVEITITIDNFFYPCQYNLCHSVACVEFM